MPNRRAQSRLAQIVSKSNRKCLIQMHFRRSFKRGTHLRQQSALRGEFDAARRTIFQMPQNFVIRLDEQFIGEVRIHHFPKFLTTHNRSSNAKLISL